MNVLIAVFCVNVITLVDASHNINYDTVFQILTGKPRKLVKSRIEGVNSQLQKRPITSKPIKKSYFVKPQAWPADQFELLNSGDKSEYYSTDDGYSKKGYKDKTLMTNHLNEDVNINKYHGGEEFDKGEESMENIGVPLRNIINSIPNVNRIEVLENHRGPTIVLLLPPKDNESPILYNTRRKILVSDSDSSSDSSSSNEKNPGNPYTVHKNKYKQNWPYNHFMDGDHMNINPFGPNFANLGPTGPELFFGRKWWYFNQDDYKPIG